MQLVIRCAARVPYQHACTFSPERTPLNFDICHIPLNPAPRGAQALLVQNDAGVLKLSLPKGFGPPK